jgi:hypothetical protein
MASMQSDHHAIKHQHALLLKQTHIEHQMNEAGLNQLEQLKKLRDEV